MKRFFYSFIRLLAYWLIGLLAFSLTALPARAQENWVDSDYARCLEAAEGGEVCKSAYASSVQSDLQADIVRKILGPVPGVTVTADAWQRNPEYVRKMAAGAAVPQIGNFIAMMYANPPADLALWIRDAGESLGFIPKQAYAQGIGFSGLAPLLPIWKAFRNIAYFLLAIVLVIIGFMVMLRKKIDPKTVVTVQNALPKIVVTLLLITFSYAISGLLIDIMYFLIVIIVYVLGSGLGFTQEQIGTLQSEYLTSGMSHVAGTIFGRGMRTLEDIVNFVFGSNLGFGTGAAGAAVGTLATILIFAGGTTNPVGWLPLAFTLGVGVLFALLVALFLLFAYIRLFFMLLSSYINIIIAIIAAPLLFLGEAFPGATTFGNWVVNLVSNLLVFPITVALLMIASALAISKHESLWAPPLLSEGTQGSYGVAGVIALGILLTIPTIVTGIRDSFKAKALIPLTAGFGQAVGAPFSTGMQMLSTVYYLRMIGADQILGKLFGKKPGPDTRQ